MTSLLKVKAVGAVGSVKQEKKTGGSGNKENIEEEAVDDPSPAPAAKPVKAKRGAQSQMIIKHHGVQPQVQASLLRIPCSYFIFNFLI